MNAKQMSGRMTPYDDEYGTAERTNATFCVYSEHTRPGSITKLLGITPTRSTEAGRLVVTKHGYPKEERCNAWFLSSENVIKSLDLRRHLDYLLEYLIPVGPAIIELQKNPGVVMRINCVWWSAHGHGGPALWPEQMRGLADLNLELDFDLYFFEDKDEGQTEL